MSVSSIVILSPSGSYSSYVSLKKLFAINPQGFATAFSSRASTPPQPVVSSKSEFKIIGSQDDSESSIEITSPASYFELFDLIYLL